MSNSVTWVPGCSLCWGWWGQRGTYLVLSRLRVQNNLGTPPHPQQPNALGGALDYSPCATACGSEMDSLDRSQMAPGEVSPRALHTCSMQQPPPSQALVPWAPWRLFFTHACCVCVPSTSVSHRNGFTPLNLSVLILKMGIITDPPPRTVQRRH